MQRLAIWLGILLGLAAGMLSAGCDVEAVLREAAPSANSLANPSAGQRAEGPRAGALGGDTIKIASFNIQVFGTSKLEKPHVMEVLAEVVRRFDAVAIQEIRSKDQSVVPRFLERINVGGARYDYVIGPRLGRTSSKEQYAVLFDTARIEPVRGSVYTVPDRDDLLHREPMVARFRVRSPTIGQPFTFSLVNVHTDPDETDLELDALDDVYLAVRHNASGEDDVILLGDLNVDERDLGELGRVPNITWVVSGQTTNTRRTKAYDNILFDRYFTAEYTGRWGVLDLESAFGLTRDQALEVSDHLPVWAEFSTQEARAASDVVRRPAMPPR
jgi:endonuclease/exonuclease/phosphatase family metal-dependent hydrolase